MKIHLLIVLCLFASMSMSQEEVEEKIFSFAEQEPQYPGGESAMSEFIVQTIEYPQSSVEKGEQGIVYVTFVVEKDGSITDVRIIRGAYELLDNEAMRVIKLMPKWIPGKQDGKIVRVQYTIPIHFRMGGGEEKLSKKELRKKKKERKKLAKEQKKKLKK